MTVSPCQLRLVLEKHIPRDRMYPLAAYDLSTERENFTLFISLLESTFADSSTKVYWLKLALLTGLEDASDIDCSAKSKISILGYFSNSIGRLTIPNSDDWVELSSVRLIMQHFALYNCDLLRLMRRNTTWHNTCKKCSIIYVHL